MGKEKIEQNVERVYYYVFGTLGCSYEDAEKIFNGALLKNKKWREKLLKSKSK